MPLDLVALWEKAKRDFLWLAPLALLWLAVCYRLSVDWEINPQYSHGWLVPFLAGMLFWQRWQTRPAPTPGTFSAAWLLLVVAILAALLPVRAVWEANPDWRLIVWAGVLAAFVLTITALQWMGGAPWRNHFFYPTAFLLVSVPWPSAVETFATQNLMRLVAVITAELLNWFGFAAEATGNLLRCGSATVEIAEACSGVRSLQAGLMATLFFGELLRLRTGARVFLLAAGVAAALAGNFLRAIFLVLLHTESGGEALTHWHDAAGLIEFVACMALIFLVALCLPQEREPNKRRGAAVPLQWPGWFTIAALVWLVAVELATQAWFYRVERGVQRRPDWTLEWPLQAPEYRAIPLPDNVVAMLRCNQIAAASWKDVAGLNWALFYIQWEPGRAAAQLARSHNPEICLPASGRQLTRRLAPVRVRRGDVVFTFQRSVFQDRETPLHVFYCLWEEIQRPEQEVALVEDWSARSRFAATWNGRRHLGQRVVEVLIAGKLGEEDALARFNAFMDGAIRVKERN